MSMTTILGKLSTFQDVFRLLISEYTSVLGQQILNYKKNNLFVQNRGGDRKSSGFWMFWFVSEISAMLSHLDFFLIFAIRAVPDGAKLHKVPSINQDQVMWLQRLIDKKAPKNFIIRAKMLFCEKWSFFRFSITEKVTIK